MHVTCNGVSSDLLCHDISVKREQVTDQIAPLLKVWLHLAKYYTGFETRLTRQVPLVEQERLTLPEHLSSVFSGVRVTRYLVLYVCFVDRCLSSCTYGHCVVCSLIYRFCLLIWYLQTLLPCYRRILKCEIVNDYNGRQVMVKVHMAFLT